MLTQFQSGGPVAAHRYAFIKARFNVFPSNVMENRISNGQISLLCDCNCGSPESLHHILLSCPHYSSLRSKLLAPYLVGCTGDAKETKLRFLLNDEDPSRSRTVAKYLNRVLALKKEKGSGMVRRTPLIQEPTCENR